MSAVRPDLPGLPETVPARMVNEFVYCPRLFYLEWVQGRFATSDDVEEGLYVHRVVDEPSADLPDPTDDLERFAGRTSRSFWLTSTALGGHRQDRPRRSGRRRRGGARRLQEAPHPDPRGRIWPSDEIQSTVQALLLQDAGYTVHQAEVWYAQTRQRLVLPIDTGRLDHLRGVLTGLWQVAIADHAPAPLENSPKCAGCALVGDVWGR